MNSIERIVGILFSGAMCKVYAVGVALWIASDAIEVFRNAMTQAAKAMQ